MTLTKRQGHLRQSRSDDDVVVGNSAAVSDPLLNIKDDLSKGVETVGEAGRAAHWPWWRRGRFLFPLGMLGELGHPQFFQYTTVFLSVAR